MPSNPEIWAQFYEALWSICAIVLGFFATFYTNQLNERNARLFERLHKHLRHPVFLKMATGTREKTQYYVSKIIGTFFLVYGLLILFGFVSIN